MLSDYGGVSGRSKRKDICPSEHPPGWERKAYHKTDGDIFDRQPCVEGNAGTLICGLTSVCRREKAGGGNPDF